MINFTLSRIVLVLGMVAVLTTVVSAQQTGTACEPYGSVTVKGEPATDNMTVVAYVGEVELARTHTTGGQYSLYIDLDNPDTPQRDGYLAGDIITIRINGDQANPAFEAFTGRQRRDIEVVTLDIQFQSWGRIKALFR